MTTETTSIFKSLPKIVSNVRSRFIPICFILAVCLSACSTRPNADIRTNRHTPDRPNFIIIMVDDMGYAGVSCFGNPYFKTPEIDRLAAEGLRFTDFHSSGAVCSPTRTGLLTGRYQQRAGVEAVIHPLADHPEHRKGLKPVEITFAEALQNAGYRTGLIGKWHQGYPHNSAEYHPQNHGFDEFIGYHSGNIDYVSHVGDHGRHDWWHGRTETHEDGYTTDLINRYALDFIKQHRDQPFCLYVAHEAIHNPVQVPGDPVRRREVPGSSIEQDLFTGWNRWKTTDEAERIEKYKGMTLPIDDGVGQIRATLEELGLDRNTCIIFFSDNGPAADFPSGSPELRGRKGSLYEGGHRVPCVTWWPGKIDAGSVTDIPAMSIDIMPTLLSLAGIALPGERPLDGVDLSPVLLEQRALPDRPLFWAGLSNKGGRTEAMRDGPWKLMVNHRDARPGTRENPTVELYNLDQDLQEQTNLAEYQSERAAAMLHQINAWIADTQKGRTPQEGTWAQVDK
jgi:arylsulfatase A